MSLRVLDENGKGAVSNLIAAINHMQEINGYGRRLRDPRREHEPRLQLRARVVRLRPEPAVRRGGPPGEVGVVVVVAAGNTGYGTLQVPDRRDRRRAWR